MWKDRQEAGEKLAIQLRALSGEALAVIPISKGGEEIAQPISDLLGAKMLTHSNLSGLHDEIIIVVDDGIATAEPILEALAQIRGASSNKIVVAIPVMPPNLIEKIRAKCDELFILSFPHSFVRVGAYYEYYPER